MLETTTSLLALDRLLRTRETAPLPPEAQHNKAPPAAPRRHVRRNKSINPAGCLPQYVLSLYAQPQTPSCAHTSALHAYTKPLQQLQSRC